MVMGGKERLGPQDPGIADIFHHGPGDGKPVKGARPAPDLVQDEEAVFCGVPQNIRHLSHFHHKRALAAGEIVRSPDSRKDPVAQADIRLLSRHKAADVGHQRNQGRLAHVSGFSGHVGAGNDRNPVFSVVQDRIIGHKGIAAHHPLHDRMAAVFDADYALFIDVGLNVIIAGRYG